MLQLITRLFLLLQRLRFELLWALAMCRFDAVVHPSVCPWFPFLLICHYCDYLVYDFVAIVVVSPYGFGSHFRVAWLSLDRL